MDSHQVKPVLNKYLQSIVRRIPIFHVCTLYNIGIQSILSILFGFVIHNILLSYNFLLISFKHKIHFTNVSYKCYYIHTYFKFTYGNTIYITNINIYRKLRMYQMPDVYKSFCTHLAFQSVFIRTETIQSFQIRSANLIQFQFYVCCINLFNEKELYEFHILILNIRHYVLYQHIISDIMVFFFYNFSLLFSVFNFRRGIFPNRRRI